MSRRKTPKRACSTTPLYIRWIKGFDRAQIVLADSARIELTADKMHMRLTLWDGEQFQNLKSDNMTVFKSQGVPYDRETSTTNS